MTFEHYFMLRFIFYTPKMASLLSIMMQQYTLTLGYIRHDPFAFWQRPIHPKPLPYYVDWFWVPFSAIKLFESVDIMIPPKSIFSSLCCMAKYGWMRPLNKWHTPLYHPIFPSYISPDDPHAFYRSTYHYSVDC